MSENHAQPAPHLAENQQSENISEETRLANIRRQVETVRLIRKFLVGTVLIAIIVPLLFYLQFGTCDGFCIGFTIFLEALCLLTAFGFYFREKKEFHTNVRLRDGGAGKLLDRVGAFWLLACAFGPFFGYAATAIFTLTERHWRWLYGIRIFLAVVLPILMALPLLRYAQGKAALVALPLLMVITALPIWSCWWTMGDFKDGAKAARILVAEKHTDSTAKPGGLLTCTFKDEPANRINFNVGDLRSFAINQEIEIVYLPHSVRVIAVR